MGNLIDKYYFSETGESGTWTDFTNWSGVRVLAVSGFDEIGESVNVYTAQWVDSDIEDYVCTKQGTRIKNGVSVNYDIVVRKNIDIELTFIVSQRYTNQTISVQSMYDTVVDTICNSGDIYIKSAYTGKIAHCVCLKSFKPTAVKLHRGRNSYILATIPLHLLQSTTNA